MQLELAPDCLLKGSGSTQLHSLSWLEGEVCESLPLPLPLPWPQPSQAPGGEAVLGLISLEGGDSTARLPCSR